MQKTFYRLGRIGSHNFGLAAFALLTIAGGSLRAQTELIALSPATLSFPVTVKGKASAPLAVTVTSTGNTAVTLTRFAIAGTDPTEFAITANTCGATLASGANCQVSITFTPSATGAQTASLTVTDSATNSPQTSNLSGNGANIVFTLRPTAIVFPVVSVGATNTSQVTVTNIGIASATISSIALGGGDTSDFVIGAKTCGTTLAAGASCTVNVTFSPKFDGIRTSNLIFTDTAAGSPQAVPLTGTAQAPTQTLIFSPTSLVFGPTDVGTLGNLGTVGVANYGSATTTFNSISLSGANPSDFFVLNSCQPLANDQTCGISVAFRPLAAGLRTAIMLVTDTAAGSPQSVLLSGTGVAGGSLLTFSPTAISFSPQNIGVSSNASLTIQNFGVAGALFSSFAISGKNASDFAIATNGCPAGSTPLASLQSCPIGITFTPSAAGVRIASLSITDNSIGSPQIIPLTGTGQALSKQLTFSNGILTFGSQTVGTNSGRASVAASSVGDTAVTLSSVLLGGADPGDFSITSTSCYSGTIIAPNSNCTVNLTFTPAAAGTRTATLTFTDDATGSPQAVTLEGVGDTTTQQLSFNYVNLDFGVLDLGSTTSQIPVTLYNLGDSTVTFTTIAVSGANASDFSITSDSCLSPNNLGPGQGCNVYVTFAPTATGVRIAQLVFTDSATGSPQTVTLSGDGQALTEIVTFSTPALVYAAQTVGTTSNQALEYFNNTGDSPIVISSVTITGGNASDFTISTNACPAGGSVGAGSYCYVYVTFTPSATGIRTSTLQFVDSATGSPHNVPLFGVGLPAVVPLSLSPTDVAFNDQNIGTTSAATGVNVYNPGGTALTLSIVLTGANASDFSILSNNCPASLGSGASCTVDVTFKPTALGSRVGALQFTAGGTVIDVGLSGIGTTGAMVLTTQQLTVDFGQIDVGSTTGQLYVQIGNTGTETVTFSSFTLGGSDPGDFTISNNNCGSTLTVGATCDVYLTFTPKAAGVRTATLQIADNAVGSPQSVPLDGIGQAVTMTLDLPPTFAFGVANIATSLSQYAYVTNVGSAPVTISSITITGTNASDFAVGTTNCTGAAITPNGGNCYFYITFTPTAAGVRTAFAQLTDNATGSPQTVALNGVGQTASLALVLPPAVVVPLTVVGTTTQSSPIYVSNVGTSAVTLSNVVITGTNASEFAISTGNCTAGTNVNPGTYCYLYITFTPTAAGTAVASIQFTDNAAGSPQSIGISAVGVTSAATLSFQPAVTLPATTIGSTTQSSPNYVYSVGTSTVTLTNVAITGTNASEFTVTGGNCTAGANINPGGYCYYYIAFTPLGIGNRTATLQFTDNAAGSPQSVTLSGVGQGITDTATLSPPSLAFGTVTVGSNNGNLYTYLDNTGTGTITISAITIAGANPGDFVLNGGSCSVGTQLTAGTSCYTYVYFMPTAKGPRTATLQITDNAVGGTQSATLTGTGQ